MIAEWQTAALGDICDLRAGSGFPISFQGKIEGKYPFAKVSDMNLPSNSVCIREANNWVDENDLSQLKAKPLPPGTTVFAKIGEALKANRLRFIIRPTIVDNNMMGAIPDRGVLDPRFFFYALSQIDFGEIAGGTALPYLTATALSKLEIGVPILAEQRAIAQILGTLDDKIELNRRMSETLEAMARALFKSWFVDFDPIRVKTEGQDSGLPRDLQALFPSGFDDSELGQIPEGWTTSTLGEIALHSRESVRPEEIEPAIPYIALEHMPRGSISLWDWSTSEEIESNKFKFSRGDLLFGKLRPYFHKIGVAPVGGICSTDIVVVKPRDAAWFGFVLGHVSSVEFVKYTDSGSTGTRMPRTSWREMARYDVVLPPHPIAQAHTAIIRPLIERIIAVVHESRTLAALRDTLLPKLISGEIRVRDAEAFLERTA